MYAFYTKLLDQGRLTWPGQLGISIPDIYVCCGGVSYHVTKGNSYPGLDNYSLFNCYNVQIYIKVLLFHDGTCIAKVNCSHNESSLFHTGNDILTSFLLNLWSENTEYVHVHDVCVQIV